MKFRMSPNVAVRTQGQFTEAVDFYTKVLGFQNRSNNPELGDLDANPINLFILEDDEFRGPVMELFVDDLDEARKTLEANGCKVLRWRGKGQDCYIQDQFGVIFNIWEEQAMPPRPRYPMPDFFREALESRGLMDAYRARPPYQQNDYIGWITRAKRIETQENRLNQMLDELEKGDVYMKMTWKPKR